VSVFSYIIYFRPNSILFILVLNRYISYAKSFTFTAIRSAIPPATAAAAAQHRRHYHHPATQSSLSFKLQSHPSTITTLTNNNNNNNNEILGSQGRTNHEEEENNPCDVHVCFSHVHLYTDHLEDISTYKSLEEKLTSFVGNSSTSSYSSDDDKNYVQERRSEWKSMIQNNEHASNYHQHQEEEEGEFQTQNRDIVKQLIAGLGFRITGMNYSPGLTKSILLTTKDLNGVKFVVSTLDNDTNNDIDRNTKNNVDGDKTYHHFDAENIRLFYKSHSDRQGIALLAFQITSGNIEDLHDKYKQMHPKLLPKDYENSVLTYYESGEGTTMKILEVYSYYKNEKGGDVDQGTKLRFVQRVEKSIKNDDYDVKVDEENIGRDHVPLPGLRPVDATYDETCMAAYCDHWVSNVISRTGFIETLEETLGFTSKVDFNAGIVAAGEAQIESTVTGNDSKFRFQEESLALRDQSQVYLPINNALSEVGHVHGFIKEIGQGIQHIASRVDDLPAFVQRANDFRQITGEGLTFLNIPRSYYGIFSTTYLRNELKDLSEDCANSVSDACVRSSRIMSSNGAINIDLTNEKLEEQLECSISSEVKNEYDCNKDEILNAILRSRYHNLYNLLGENLSEETYLSIVRNKILVDVQGNDLLFQIFTSNILQRNVGDESPFLEFIQRVCSSSISDDPGTSTDTTCPVEMKAGCGGFGIRNFLTLFLSIEVGKAMLEVSQAKERHDADAVTLAERKVSIFTDQLNEANPILTAIADAMTEEGNALNAMQEATRKGNRENAESFRKAMEAASAAKNANNEKLMDCSMKYNNLMKNLRTATNLN